MTPHNSQTTLKEAIRQAGIRSAEVARQSMNRPTCLPPTTPSPRSLPLPPLPAKDLSDALRQLMAS
ncbi:hypothetical protein D3C85_1257760 [compost metagenome]